MTTPKKPSMSFLAFVDRFVDAKVIPPLTRAQYALAGFAFDGVIVDDCEDLVFEMFGHTTPRYASVFALLKGARGGGTTLTGLRMLHLGMCTPLPPRGPGSHPVVSFVGPREDQGVMAYDVAKNIVESSPALSRLVERRPGARKGEANITTHEFTLQRPGDQRKVRFAVFPATAGGRALRGYTHVASHMTEAGFIASAADGRVLSMDDQITAVASRIVPGSQLILESSAWNAAGTFMTMVRRAHGNADPTSHELAAIATTPMLRAEHPEIIELFDREMARDPQKARTEFLCIPPEYGNDAQAFPPALLEKCIAIEPAPPLSSSAARALGADHAHVRDASALVACTKTSAGIYAAEILAIPSPSKPSEVAAKFAEVARRARVSIMTDGHQRPALAEHYDEHGVSLAPAPEGARGKEETYQRLRGLMSEGVVKLPHPDTSPEARGLHAQLAAITCKPTPGGGWSFTSPRRGGAHGDIASALVLAVWQLRHVDDDMSRSIIIHRGSARAVRRDDDARTCRSTYRA